MNGKKMNTDALIASKAREHGYEYTAKYIEMFGMKAWNPSFTKGLCGQAEEYYKKCVEEGHPYDWYIEYPEDAMF